MQGLRVAEYVLQAQVGYVLPGVQHGRYAVVGEDVGRNLLEDMLRREEAQDARWRRSIYACVTWSCRHIPSFPESIVVPAAMSSTCAPFPRPSAFVPLGGRILRTLGPTSRNTSATFITAAVRIADDVWYCRGAQHPGHRPRAAYAVHRIEDRARRRAGFNDDLLRCRRQDTDVGRNLPVAPNGLRGVAQGLAERRKLDVLRFARGVDRVYSVGHDVEEVKEDLRHAALMSRGRATRKRARARSRL